MPKNEYNYPGLAAKVKKDLKEALSEIMLKKQAEIDAKKKADEKARLRRIEITLPRSRFGALPEYKIPVPREKKKHSLGRFQPNLRPQVEGSNISNLVQEPRHILTRAEKLAPVTMKAARK